MRFAGIALLLLLIPAYLGGHGALVRVGQFLDVSEPPAGVDYVYILGGDWLLRPLVAARLFHSRLAGKILISDVEWPQDYRPYGASSEAAATRDLLKERGVPDDAIMIIAGKVESTADEAGALTRFTRDHRGRSVAIVTAGYHSRRARWIFRRRIGDTTATLRFVSASSPEFDALHWWQSAPVRLAYLTEYAKLLYYWLRY